jgi:hypothetical protein
MYVKARNEQSNRPKCTIATVDGQNYRAFVNTGHLIFTNNLPNYFQFLQKLIQGNRLWFHRPHKKIIPSLDRIELCGIHGLNQQRKYPTWWGCELLQSTQAYQKKRSEQRDKLDLLQFLSPHFRFFSLPWTGKWLGSSDVLPIDLSNEMMLSEIRFM